MELSNFFEKIKVIYWYQIVLALGSFFLALSLTINFIDLSNSIVQLISLASILIGLGETVNHTLETTAGDHGGRRYSYQKRVRGDKAIGWVLNIAGALLILATACLIIANKFGFIQ